MAGEREVYTLSPAVVAEIRALKRQVEQLQQAIRGGRISHSGDGAEVFHVLAPTGGIPGIDTDTDTPGSAECALEWIGPSGYFEPMLDEAGDEQLVTVYNDGPSVAEGQRVKVVRMPGHDADELLVLHPPGGVEQCATFGGATLSLGATVSSSDEYQWSWPTPPGPYPRHPNLQDEVSITGGLNQYITLQPGVYVVHFGVQLQTTTATGTPSKDVRFDIKTTGTTGPNPLAGGRSYLTCGQNDGVYFNGGLGTVIHGTQSGTCAVLVKVAAGNEGKLSLVRTQGAISCGVLAWATVIRKAELPA